MKRISTTKPLAWLSLLLAFALIAAACSSDSSDTTEATTPTTAAPGETTTTGAAPTTAPAPTGPTGSFSTYIGEPESLTTLNNNESEGIAVLQSLYTMLIDYDAQTSEPTPGVAESITSDDGGLTWVIVLEDGWTFHDGTPVTASSFVDAWNYGAVGSNAQQNAGFFGDIAGFEDVNAEGATATEMSGLVVDNDLQFTVTLSQPQSFWNIKLGYPAYAPLPEAFYADPAAFNEAPIGNGPFMMDGKWEHNTGIFVQAYPDYAGPNPALVESIEFRIYADVNTAISDLEAGNLDIVDSVTAERVDEVKSLVPNFGESPSSSINYLGIPQYLPKLGGDENRDLRAALSMAIDKKAITDAIFNGRRKPAFNLLSPVIPGYQESVCESWDYDPVKAKELFDAAGGWTGDMIVWFNSGAGHENWVEAVVNQWTNVLGIPANSFKFEQLQFADYLGKLDAREATGPFRLGWGMDYPHPQNYLELILAGWMFPPTGANDTFFDNPDFNDALEAALAETDFDLAVPLYQEAARVACENVPLIPMFYGLNSFAWNDTVNDVYVNAFGNINYTEITANN